MSEEDPGRVSHQVHSLVLKPTSHHVPLRLPFHILQSPFLQSHFVKNHFLRTLFLLSIIGCYCACTPETTDLVHMQTGGQSSGDLNEEGGQLAEETMSMGEGGEAGGISTLMEDPWIQMGTGFRRFESLESGQRVPIIAGIQGGFHVWGAFQGGGFVGENVNVLFKLYLGGRHLAEADYFEYFLPVNADGQFEYTGVSVIYFENDDVEPTSGQQMRLTLEVKTEEGLMLNDEMEIIPICCE